MTAPRTFLFTDIVGSTRLWEHDPDAMTAALQQHDELMQHIITAHTGKIFKTVGDAVCAVFEQPRAALDAAIELQRALTAATWPTSSPIQVRMALHHGQAEERNNDYFGPPLNRVARLLAAGHGGQIIISQRMYHELATLAAAASLEDLGAHRLRDLGTPEHIYQVNVEDLPHSFPPLRSLEAFAHNLPTQLTSFIGRTSEMQAVRSALQQARLVSLLGPGGTGKTRLSLQVGADSLEHFEHGVWFIELALINDPELVPVAIAGTVGVREEAQRPLLQSLVARLAERQVLLIFDNCEHVIERAAHVAEHLLQFCPRLRILATSREPLGVRGEISLRIAPLQIPQTQAVPNVHELGQIEAVRLFVQRAEAVDANWQLNERNAAAVASICQHLDGIPLALELAAARVAALSVEQIAERLSDRFRLLRSGSRTASPRQQTLRGLIDWSYDLLSPTERILLARLAIFVGPVRLQAIERVCADEDLEQWEIIDVLDQVVHKSLVQVERRSEQPPMYRMLETIRQYAFEKLQARSELEVLQQRHYDWIFAEVQADPYATGWIYLDSIRAALAWCQQAPARAEQGLSLAVAMMPGWNLMGLFEEARAWLNLWLENEAIPLNIRAWGLHTSAYMAFRQDLYDLAQNHYQRFMDIQMHLEQPLGVANGYRGLGDVARAHSRYAEAEAHYRKALEIMDEEGDQGGKILPTIGCAIVLFHVGRYAEAAEMLETIDTTVTNAHSISLSMWYYRNVGMTLIAQERFAAAEQALDKALSYVQPNETGSVYCYILLTQSLLYGLTARFEDALNLAQTAGTLLIELGDRWAVAWSYQLRGLIYNLADQPSQAYKMFITGLDMYIEAKNVGFMPDTLLGLASCYMVDNQIEHALKLYAAAQTLATTHMIVFSPPYRSFAEKILKLAQADLSDSEYQAAWNTGASWELEQVRAFLEQEPPTQDDQLP